MFLSPFRLSDLHTGLECIKSYTRRCMSQQERQHFQKLYFGTNEMIKDLCAEGTYQEGTYVIFNLIFSDTIPLREFVFRFKFLVRLFALVADGVGLFRLTCNFLAPDRFPPLRALHAES
jgi:hypothetical protein